MAGCVPLLGGIPALKPLLRQAEAAMDSMDYDRAQALYRRVANSYDVALPDSDRLLCLYGIYGCCDIEMNKGNYSEALENLNLAEKIVEREKTSDMKLQVRYGAMYIIMAQQTLNAKFLQKSLYHDSIALPKAFSARNDELIYRSFCNMALCHFGLGTVKQMAPFVQQMKRYAATTSSWRPRLALYIGTQRPCCATITAGRRLFMTAP